ncbi:hypothetical protein DFJ74DRAFT_746388 [Hyaloraphidium curvatum]|nr:hypothetical protein DFJ74DRAFT_746388 [Hyaloraphidium curvatum]
MQRRDTVLPAIVPPTRGLPVQLQAGENSPSPATPISAEPSWASADACIELVGVPPDFADQIRAAAAADDVPLAALKAADAASLRWPTLGTLPLSACDPFTLDSFSKLLRAHARAGKDLIVARVTTVSSGKLFHDIYAAHAINRVLFRTQQSEGLLHRMKARNPLNNLEIVGDVWYYSVNADEARTTLAALKGNGSWHKRSRSVGPPGYRAVGLGEDPPALVETTIRTFPPVVTVEDCDRSSPIDAVELRPEAWPDLPPPYVRPGAESVKPPAVGQSVIFGAKFIGTDDDFLMKAETRAYFRANALDHSEAVLFELSGAAAPAEDNALPHPALPGFRYTLDTTDGDDAFDAENATPLQHLRRMLFQPLRPFNSAILGLIFTPVWRTIVLSYILAAILVIKFVGTAAGTVVYVVIAGLALMCAACFVFLFGA